jgi:hypothetical protein
LPDSKKCPRCENNPLKPYLLVCKLDFAVDDAALDADYLLKNYAASLKLL